MATQCAKHGAVLFTTVCIVLASFSGAIARDYTALLYLVEEPAGYPCGRIVDDGNGVKSVYVMSLYQIYGARFAIREDPDVTMTYIGESVPAGSSGTAHEGLSVCIFQNCLEQVPPIQLARIDYMSHGTSGYCCSIEMVPAPGFDTIDGVTCDRNWSRVGVLPLWINPGIDCDTVHGCEYATDYYNSNPVGNFCEGLPVAESTWGSIKALYD